MRYACLFSGIGAPLQAAYRVYENVEHVFSCEFDKFARQSFKAIYGIGDKHFHKDVREMDGTQYQGKVDVLVGGSPCQSFSIAGLREGTDDQRGQLIYQYVRIVEDVKAPVIIYENVKGIMSIDSGNTVKEFIQALRDVGYYCHYEVLNSKDYGVPQNRERVFLVGFLDYEAYYRFQFAPKHRLTKRLKDVLEKSVDEKYYLSETAIKGFQTLLTMQGGGQEPKIICDGFIPSRGENGIIHSIGGINKALKATEYKAPSLISEPKILAMRGRYNEDRTTFQQIEPRPDDLTNTITSVQKDNLICEPKIEIRGSAQANAGVMYDCCTALTSAMGMGGGQIPIVNRIRKLTPLECWRLQDFPDEAHDKAKAAGVSNSQLYRQAGNSMTVAVLEMIFRQIEKAKAKHPQSLF